MSAVPSPPAVRRRRRIGVLLLVLVALALALVTGVVAAVSGEERVARLWISATVADDGSARIVEVIDYDFAANDRHGVLREVPDLDSGAPVEVSSPDAPDDVSVEPDGDRTLIRVGDPDSTVSGEHRYTLSYTLRQVSADGELAWDAVGTGWDVPIDTVEVHVVAATALEPRRCVRGSEGSTGRCAISARDSGELVVRAEGLDAGEGVTVYATPGAALDGTPALPDPPAAAPGRPGAVPVALGALAGVLALLAGLPVSRLLRRAGRERVPAVGLPAAVPDARIDLSDLAAAATPSPSLPGSLDPAQGGVLLAGTVEKQHRAAWLLAQAAAGTIDLESDPALPDSVTMVRRAAGEGATRTVLDRAFAGRDRLELGSYDVGFAAAWQQVGELLSGWQRSSGLEDGAARRRAGWVRWLGGLAGAAGAALALVGAALSAGSVAGPLLLAAAGGVLAGAGAAAAIRGWELRVLTPEGSAAWLQVESLRQFLAAAPQTAIDQAIAGGQVGRYTAWALALGEADRWSQLARGATVPAGGAHRRQLAYAGYGPVFLSSCASTSVSPSSSSSSSYSGGGGGSVGGGSGGGGGGSW